MNKRLLLAFIKKELSQTLRDKRMRGLLFIAPVMQMTLFGLALSSEVRNVNVALYAAPGDQLAWDLAHRAEATHLFNLKAAPSADPFEDVKSGKIDAALVAPAGGLDKAAGRGPAKMQLLIDASNSTRAQSIAAYFNNITQAVIQERLIQGQQTAPPRLSLEPRVLYNPSLNTTRFMVPGVLALLLTLVTLTLTSSSITREKERGTFEMLISAPVGKGTLLLGKAVPFVLLGLMEMPLVLGVAHFGFNVPIRGTLLDLYIASSAFIVCTVSLGILLSSMANNQQQAMLGSFLLIYPIQMLSGIIYPIENMPKALYWTTYFNPLRYFAILIRNIMLKGGDPGLFWPNVGALAVLATFLFSLAWVKFSQTLN
jgi:ABC-2 type transport system permease protein